ncbi:hypothetical protein KTH93_13515 [Acinetobacter bereziniae]|uniref:hypothetical protein n=1 Tax=Acinetobacter bereziniae TaxID=106648 RepID=UPI0021CF1474|nr:hypothetical protein [Acinetobacter bereziniae]MCU4436486.1 hypothetical protein [Acinetobacter bereziniae]
MKNIESVMNVIVSEHQRSILATMGVDLWVNKVDVQTRHYQSALYRDIEQSHPVIHQPFEPKNLSTQIDAERTQKPSNITAEKTQVAEVTLLERNPETQLTEEVSTSQHIQQHTHFGTESALELSAFEIQAYAIEHCLLLVETTDLNAEQLTLWSNIQRAVSGHTHELKWPFPLPQYQDGRGANLYIQGFIDALSVERKVISLGQITHLGQQDILELPSLDEMLKEPLLKRRLWQMMQK